MDKVRGFVHFEERNIDDVREDFKYFNIPGLRYAFFNGLARLKRKIEMPGVFIDGDLDLEGQKDYSGEIVELLRNRVGLAGHDKNWDVSGAAANEDYIIHIKKGDLLEGRYVGVRILPPYPDAGKLGGIASNLRNVIRADDIFVRGVEKILYKDDLIDKRCIDLIGEFDFYSKKKELEDFLESNKVVLEGYTLIDLLG